MLVTQRARTSITNLNGGKGTVISQQKTTSLRMINPQPVGESLTSTSKFS